MWGQLKYLRGCFPLPLHDIQAGSREQRFLSQLNSPPTRAAPPAVFDVCLSRWNTSRQSSAAQKTQHDLLGFSGKKHIE